VATNRPCSQIGLRADCAIKRGEIDRFPINATAQTAPLASTPVSLAPVNLAPGVNPDASVVMAPAWSG